MSLLERRTVSVYDAQPVELACKLLPRRRSRWLASLTIEQADRRASAHAGATFDVGRKTQAVERVEASDVAGDVRVWLEARAGFVRLMVEAPSGPATVRVDLLRELPER